ncbi:hypothetical protein F3K02_12480 [Hydrogenophaga sp. D2P1]|uniref:Uncharacterized protein n=1 Tax=Hydrogenophaga aromaticivorans TaxID=2610898 RepID=A0A7Y8GWZ5_9BURK|nr:hypothetical protein [Hydrogenophaga aromaticivorans]NWF46061.1 hypothetical protein [Hydrogenophaga aromaticivorans]
MLADICHAGSTQQLMKNKHHHTRSEFLSSQARQLSDVRYRDLLRQAGAYFSASEEKALSKPPSDPDKGRNDAIREIVEAMHTHGITVEDLA